MLNYIYNSNLFPYRYHIIDNELSIIKSDDIQIGTYLI